MIIENATIAGDGFLIFFMNNATVHNKLQIEEICKNSNQRVLFNALHSPELNPIENFLNSGRKQLWQNIQAFIPKKIFTDVYKKVSMR